MIKRAQIKEVTTGGAASLTQAELFEVFNGTNLQGKIQTFFEETGFNLNVFKDASGRSLFRNNGDLTYFGDGNGNRHFSELNNDVSVFRVNDLAAPNAEKSVFLDTTGKGVFSDEYGDSALIDKFSGESVASLLAQIFKAVSVFKGFASDPTLGKSVFLNDTTLESIFKDNLGKGIFSVTNDFFPNYNKSVFTGLNGQSVFVNEEGASLFEKINNQLPFTNVFQSGRVSVNPVPNKVLIYEGGCILINLNIFNPNANTIFLKFYNSGNLVGVNIGVTQSVYVIPVPPNSSVLLDCNSYKIGMFLGCVISVTTGYLDSSVATPLIEPLISTINLKPF